MSHPAASSEEIEPAPRHSMLTWQRLLPAMGIVLVSLNLRAGVTSLSAIYGFIAQDITDFNVPMLGVVPVLCFALFGALTSKIATRLGYEGALICSMLMIFIGIALRSLTDSFNLFILYSLIALAGMGFGNVLIQPLVKKYFPDHIGEITAIFAVMLAISGGLPPAIAVPISNLFGWRANVMLWALVALLAGLLWLTHMWLGLHKVSTLNRVQLRGAATTHTASTLLPVWRWPVAWAMVMLFGVGMMSMYTMLNWLPTVLTQQGISVTTAGSILGIYIMIGVFHSILIPVYLGKMKKPYLVVCLAGVLQIIGYMGYLYAPAHAWVWTVITAPGLMTVPTTFQLINMRTRTVSGAAALSSFTQGIGYVFAAIGPFLFGYLHSITGNWQVSFWFMTAMSLLMMIAGRAAVHNKFLEDMTKN
jgi:CP family cyanate transporter-like MFS transporter